MRLRLLLSVLPVILFAGILSAQDPEVEINFNRDIRPLLADRCFLCHGPDEAGRKAGLRLDLEEEAHDIAFVPGDPDDSVAWERILSDDADEVMPPPDSHKTLNDDEKQLIRLWIEQGARYDRHWAFSPIANPDVPDVDDARFAGTPIDSFIYRSIADAGLSPSESASRETLIRRVTLDLTGLPPTIAEIDAFLADSEPDAYEKVVDRLLASPGFGERMAIDWLDLARYGDTSVFHADGPREMWRWRDWVVQAYNENMPYDQFTRRQLAGDLLPDRTIEDQVASGFNRNNASTDEGGAIAEEFRIEYAIDRVKTTSMIWMGLSMECAQCHDHKYDPISQEDYYRFFAFFNQADDPGMQSRRGNQAPLVDIQDPEKTALLPDVRAKLKSAEQQLADLRQSQKSPFEKWLSRDNLLTDEPRPATDMSACFRFDGIDSEQTTPVNEILEEDEIVLEGKVDFPEGRSGLAIRTKPDAFLRSPSTAEDFDGSTAISYGCWVKLAAGQNGAPIARMNEGDKHAGFDLFLQNDGVAAHFIHKWPQDAVKVIAPKKLEKDKWHHLFVTYNGNKKADGIRIYVDGEFIESKPSHNALKGSTLTSVPFSIGRRQNGSQFNGFVDEVRVYDRELSADEVATLADFNPLPQLLALDPGDRTDKQNDQIFEIYLGREVARYGELTGQIQALNSEIESLNSPITTVMVMKDVDEPRMTYVLDRGQYDSPDKSRPVDPGVPGFLPAIDETFPRNRLGMADWLTSPDHPLTSRVTVNRIWKLFFGTGIVETAEEFGRQGTWPSHPQLLDWLARDFADNGWDVKRLVKMIVTTETYRQSSVVTPQQLERDPGNRLLSRGPRFRLAGEFLRDQALAVSGLLNPEMGGPGVKPYQPEGLWNEVSLDGNLRFKRDDGDKLYRRSLYTYWKRSSPPPNMTLFDAPTREKCTVRRGRTNTPLQALVLMNDPQFVEAAKLFAAKILIEGGDTFEQQVQFAVRTVTARQPTTVMTQTIREIYQQELKTFSESPQRAEKLLAVGETSAAAKLDAAEHAAWTVIANLLLNLDEFVTRG